MLTTKKCWIVGAQILSRTCEWLTKKKTVDGEAAMATLTASNPLEMYEGQPHHGGGSYILGHRIPDGVRFLQSGRDMLTDGYTVFWINEKKGVHNMTLQEPIDDDSITALIVAMRLSCS